jgi:hypothetical protein
MLRLFIRVHSTREPNKETMNVDLRPVLVVANEEGRKM